MVRLDIKSFCDKFDRHPSISGENFMEKGGYSSQVINDDDSNTHISRQMT